MCNSPFFFSFLTLQHLGKECFQSGMLRVREQFLRRLVLLDLAVIDEDDAVGHLTGEAHFVGDHQHGDAGVGKLLHQFQNLAHHFGVEGAGGLVEQDHVRIHGKGTGNGNALLLAAGKALGVGIGLVGQAHAGQQLVGLVGDGLLILQLQQGGGQLKVLLHGQVGEQVEVLEHHAHLLAHSVNVGFIYLGALKFDDAEATRNAREAAIQFANDSDSKLGKIRTATQGYFSIEDTDSSTPFMKKLRVVTNVTYNLED